MYKINYPCRINVIEEIFEISGKALMLSYWKLAQGQQCAQHNCVNLYST